MKRSRDRRRPQRLRWAPTWLRWAAIVLLLLVVVAGAVTWWHQDLPRRLVREAIAERLDAEVSLGRLQVLDARSFRLHELCIREWPTLPELDSLCIGRLEIEASLEQAKLGNFDRLHAHDARLRLRPLSDASGRGKAGRSGDEPASKPPASAPAAPKIAWLRLEPARVTVLPASNDASNVGSSQFEVEGEIEHIGFDPPQGQLRGQLQVVTVGDEGATATIPLLDLLRVSPAHKETIFDTTGPTFGPGRILVQIRRGRIDEIDLRLDLPGAPPPADDAQASAFSARALFPISIEARATAPAESLKVPSPVQASSGVASEEVQLFPTLPLSFESSLTLQPAAPFPLLSVEGTLATDLKQGLDLSWKTASFDLAALPLHYSSRDLDLQAVGRISGTGRLSGSISNPVLDARWSGQNLRAQVMTSSAPSDDAMAALTPLLRMRDGKWTADLRWSPFSKTSDSSLQIKDLDLQGVVDLDFLAAAQPFALTLEGDLDGIGTGETWQAKIDSAQLRLPDIGQISAAGHWSAPSSDGRTSASWSLDADLDTEALSLDQLRGWLHPEIVAQLPLAAHATYGGVLRAHGVRFSNQSPVRKTAQGPTGAAPTWRLEGQLELRDGAYSSADSTRVVDDLDLDSHFALQQAAASSTGDATAVDIRLSIPPENGLQLLWETFYLNLAGAEPDLQVTGQVEHLLALFDAPPTTSPCGLPAPLAADLKARLTMADGPTINSDVQVRPSATETTRAANFDLEIDWPRLGPGYHRYLQPTFPDSLGDLDVQGALHLTAGVALDLSNGTISEAEASCFSQLQRDLQRQLRGQLTVRDLRARSTDGATQLQGVELSLPFDLRRTDAASGPGGSRDSPADRNTRGSLAFQSFRFAGLDIQGTQSDLVSQADSLSLAEPLVLPLFGGHLELDRVVLRDLLDPERRRAETSAQLRGLQLASIADSLGMLPLEGRIDGHLPNITLRDFTTGGSLQVEGGSEVAVFGGSARIEGISGSDVLTAYPRITFSAEFDDIDLLQVTRRFDFGEMTGRVEGQLQDCELFGGTPVRCQGRLQSIADRSVARTVSVKAVRNLTILGTGNQSATLLDRGIQRLIDRYTYSRLGVEMQLENDVFLLRGLERRGDKELFLRGRLPLSIDVVNAQPGRTISFQAMVRRLENLDFSSIRTE